MPGSSDANPDPHSGRIRQAMLPALDHKTAVKNYIKALNKGVLKVMSKMGISALQSYCGAQVFEAIGLNTAFIDKYFTHTTSRVGGVGIEVIAEEVQLRHDRGSLPDGCPHSLHRAATHVANGEDPVDPGLQRQRRSLS